MKNMQHYSISNKRLFLDPHKKKRNTTNRNTKNKRRIKHLAPWYPPKEKGNKMWQDKCKEA